MITPYSQDLAENSQREQSTLQSQVNSILALSSHLPVRRSARKGNGNTTPIDYSGQQISTAPTSKSKKAKTVMINGTPPQSTKDEVQRSFPAHLNNIPQDVGSSQEDIPHDVGENPITMDIIDAICVRTLFSIYLSGLTKHKSHKN